jgi:hypothetical protein
VTAFNLASDVGLSPHWGENYAPGRTNRLERVAGGLVEGRPTMWAWATHPAARSLDDCRGRLVNHQLGAGLWAV